MVREIVWTKRANYKFNTILEYLELEWGDRVTRNFIKRTYDIIQLNSENPELGTLENQERNIRGFLLTKHNRLFYRFTDTELIVLNFFDTRSGPKRIKF
jgi:plasmid stabilization system protein ParE